MQTLKFLAAYLSARAQGWPHKEASRYARNTRSLAWQQLDSAERCHGYLILIAITSIFVIATQLFRSYL